MFCRELYEPAAYFGLNSALYLSVHTFKKIPFRHLLCSRNVLSAGVKVVNKKDVVPLCTEPSSSGLKWSQRRP